MKYVTALVVMVTCLPCLADDMEQAVEDAMGQAVQDAKAAGIEAIEEVAEIDPAEFEVSTKSHEKGVEYFRRDQLILVERTGGSGYHLCKKGVIFATVIVNKDWSPQIILQPNLDFHVSLMPLEEGAWELTALGGDPEFLEVYIITSESVSPASAERYLEEIAQVRGSRAAFKSMGDSMLGVLESGEADEAE